MTKCQHKGCERRATHSPCLEIPATGWPIGTHTPIRLFSGIEMCRKHASEYRIIPNEETIAAATEMTRVAGKLPPDFSRAYVVAVRTDENEWRKYKEIINAERSKHTH